MRRGRFIVFEGIDGSGKTSTLQAVAAALVRDGIDVHVTREETDQPTGAWVRQSIAEGMDPLATTFLFLADRAQHLPAIEAHLAKGTHVLCDRFSMSTFAYQGVTLQGRVPDPFAFLRSLHAPLALQPDHTLLFRTEVGKAIERTKRRGQTTHYERAGFLEKVQAAYLALAQSDARTHVLDSGRDAAVVASEAETLVRAWLKS